MDPKPELFDFDKITSEKPMLVHRVFRNAYKRLWGSQYSVFSLMRVFGYKLSNVIIGKFARAKFPNLEDDEVETIKNLFLQLYLREPSSEISIPMFVQLGNWAVFPMVDSV